MQDRRFTGGYAWTEGSRMKGDPDAVADALITLKDPMGRVGVDAMKQAWRKGNAALRETMGNEAHCLDIGVEAQVYKIFRSLEYQVVNVRTEDTAPGGRVFRTVHEITHDPDAPTRQFVHVASDTISLGRLSAYQLPPTPPTPAPAASPSATRALMPPVPRDREMEAWVALLAWRERYGDVAMYAPVLAAIDALRD